MGTEYRSVRLTADAYDALSRRKQDDESFSEVVERLASERPIADLADTLSEDDVASIRAARSQRYEAYANLRTEKQS